MNKIEPLTITKLLVKISNKEHPAEIIKLAKQMKSNFELSDREFKILMTVYSK